MNSRYNISDDGTIFQIKEDGSITKLAKIDNSGQVSGINEQPSSSSGKGWYWFFIIVLGILSIVFIYLYSEANNSLYYYQYNASTYQDKADNLSSQNSSLQQQLSQARNEKTAAERELSNFKSMVGQSMPLIISDIEIANIDINGNIDVTFGSTIYSSRTMYLQPKLKYTGISSGNRTLYVKYYYPNGQLSTGTSSPSGYSTSSNVYIWSGNNEMTLSGWGNSSRGHWSSGNYRIEIWYNNTCLKSKNFRIY